MAMVEMAALPLPSRVDLEIDIRLRTQVHVTAFSARRKVSRLMLDRVSNLLWSLLLPAGWLRIPGVAGAVLSATQSDLTPADYPALAQLALFLATGRVESVVLGNDYTTPWTTPNGAYVLLPNWDAILPQVDALLR